MSGYSGPERRQAYVPLDEQLLAAISHAVRAEIDEARKAGSILSEEERLFVRQRIDSAKFWARVRERVIQSALGWAVIGLLGTVGIAVWSWLERQVLR